MQLFGAGVDEQTERACNRRPKSAKAGNRVRRMWAVPFEQVGCEAVVRVV